FRSNGRLREQCRLAVSPSAKAVGERMVPGQLRKSPPLRCTVLGNLYDARRQAPRCICVTLACYTGSVTAAERIVRPSGFVGGLTANVCDTCWLLRLTDAFVETAQQWVEEIR